MVVEERKRSGGIRREEFDEAQCRRRRDEYEEREEESAQNEDFVVVEDQEADASARVEGMDEERGVDDIEGVAMKKSAKGSNINNREDGNKKRGRGNDSLKKGGGEEKETENVAVVNLIDPTNIIPQRHWICSKCKTCREYVRDVANKGYCQSCRCDLIFHLKGEDEYEHGTLEDFSDGEFGEFDSQDELEKRNFKDDEDSY
jgi:hypothetical protein